MLNDLESLPNDPAELQGMVTLLSSELKNRDIKIADLKHQLAGHNRHRFGSTSESLDQLQLFVENDEIVVAAQTEPRNLKLANRRTSHAANPCPIIWNAKNRYCHLAIIAASAVAT